MSCVNSIIKPMVLSGKEVWPIIEGGKGIGISDCYSASAFANSGAIGTFSGAVPKLLDDNGDVIPIEYKEKTRKGRHWELSQYTVSAIISQAKRAFDLSAGKGRIHMNVLWEAGGTEYILKNSLQKLSGLVHGVTAGAGMPFNLGEIASKCEMYYYPIVSSMRAFRILWKKTFHKFSAFLGGVVYECPWRAGGHLGLLPKDDKNAFLSPIPELKKIREYMNSINLHSIPIIMAGGVWNLKDWAQHMSDETIAPLAFQFGTRPVVTQESPVSLQWKRRLMSMKKDKIVINSFSPTGFPSSAVQNKFLRNLQDRSKRQIKYSRVETTDLKYSMEFGARKRKFYINPEDVQLVTTWVNDGFSVPMMTPESTFIFVTQEEFEQITSDQINCMGCLSHCAFSNWRDRGEYTTGKKADPRSFCIQKTLQNIAYGADIENELMFSGSNGYKFMNDPFYDNFRKSLDPKDLPYISELVQAILSGK